MYNEEEFVFWIKSLYVLNLEGIESFSLVSILKFGPFIGTPNSGKSASPRFTTNSIGSIISSTILNLSLISKSRGKGSYNLIPNSPSWYIIFTPKILLFSPKFRVKSLKKPALPNWLINLLIASESLSNNVSNLGLGLLLILF